jgi:putative FmdB family regulatory protein
MPTYEYECEKCGLIFEEFQSITAPPLTKCKKEGCGGAVRRLLSGGAGFLFKGSGFYITDYRSESYKKAATSEKGASAPAPAEKNAAKTGNGTASAPPSAPAAAKKGDAVKKE